MSFAPIPSIILDEVVERALTEDLSGGDLTTEATVDSDAVATARATAKSELVACGAEVFARVFYLLEPGVRVLRLVEDGEAVPAGTDLWQVDGPTWAILQGERTALNFAQRMSGIATQTRHFVDALPKPCRTRITDTRKTTPGLRLLERYSVRCGGGHNHRDALGAGVLIKDNHIAAAGGIAAAIQRARERAPHTTRIEIEVESLDGLDQALEAGADIIMLDDFPAEVLDTAVQRVRGQALIEVSGSVTLSRIPELVALGVDIISVGALTHSAPAADIALNLTPI